MPEVKGKPGPMDWISFVARRKLNIQAWVEYHRFKVYKDVQDWCEKNGVEAPQKREVASCLPKGKKKPKDASKDENPSEGHTEVLVEMVSKKSQANKKKGRKKRT